MTAPPQPIERQHRPWLVLTAAALLVLTIAAYVWIMAAEGERVGAAAVVLVILAVALAGAIGAWRLRVPERRGLAGAGAAGVLLSMGFLALFSIGLPLFVAGVLMLVWLIRTRHGRRDRSDRIALAFVAGLALPWLLLVT